MAPESELSVARVTVVGAGTMGHGIAQVAAVAGLHTRLFDSSATQLAAAERRIHATLQGGIERGKLTAEARDAAISRLAIVTSLGEAADDADLLIEAIPERIEWKEELFREADALLPVHALLASNTSSLSITRMAAATSRRAQVVGLHFFNPVHLMNLLEVVRGRETSGATLATALAFARQLGKEPIVVTDTPGFATSRLGVVLGLEAIRMVEQGVAAPADIDRAMELGYNHPIGPLRLTDLVGLDVRLGIADHLHSELGGDQYRAPALLRRMVEEGRLGKKTGRGFYSWSEP